MPHLAHLQHRASLLTLLHVPELSLLNEEMILSFPLLPRKNISSTEAFVPWASSLSRAPARQESDIVVLAWPGGAIAEAKGGGPWSQRQPYSSGFRRGTWGEEDASVGEVLVAQV